jgi:hypothetical protein
MGSALAEEGVDERADQAKELHDQESAHLSGRRVLSLAERHEGATGVEVVELRPPDEQLQSFSELSSDRPASSSALVASVVLAPGFTA